MHKGFRKPKARVLGSTCVAVRELAGLRELETMRAEPINEIIVIREDAQPVVHQVAEIKDGSDVGILPGVGGEGQREGICFQEIKYRMPRCTWSLLTFTHGHHDFPAPPGHRLQGSTVVSEVSLSEV